MNLPALREIKAKKSFGPQDTLVIFGEFFKGGYVSGLIREAQKKGMNIIYSTVGRRDLNQKLQKTPLEDLYLPSQSSKALSIKLAYNNKVSSQNFVSVIDVPLEAGFDMEPADSGTSPIGLCQKIRLNEWEKAKLDTNVLKSAQQKARLSFESRVQLWLKQLEKLLPQTGHVLIAHTMAGGVPRAKIFMPILNRVFKGRGKRFFSSEAFWQTDLGKLCEANFKEVTANTFKTLITLSAPLRERLKTKGRQISYTAYSYHGTEVLIGKNYVWQTYSPYLQGFAKIELENISKQFFAQGVNTCVFNVPEILTKSSAIFPGVEIPLYTLLGAIQKEGGAKGQALIKTCLKKLKPDALPFIMENTKKYFESPIIKEHSHFERWPQHISLSQMEQMGQLSQTLFGLHKEGAESITPFLSEVVFGSTGRLISQEMTQPSQPICWLNHDIIARDIHKNGI